MNRNIVATILIILGIGMYFTVTDGLYNEAKAVSEVNVQYLSAIESAKKLISTRDKLLNDYSNLSPEDRDRLDKMVPKSVDNIRLIIDLNTMGLRHGLSLKNIKATTAAPTTKATNAIPVTMPEPVVGPGSNQAMTSMNMQDVSIPVPSLETVKVTFGMSATYDQFITFLEDMEANLRIMDLQHLTVTSNDNGIYDWSLEFQTYWLKSQ